MTVLFSGDKQRHLKDLSPAVAFSLAAALTLATIVWPPLSRRLFSITNARKLTAPTQKDGIPGTLAVGGALVLLIGAIIFLITGIVNS